HIMRRAVLLVAGLAVALVRQPSAISAHPSSISDQPSAISDQPSSRAQPPDPAKEARLKWFREAKYGLFIHWGLYAIPAGQWNGKRSLGLGEWVMFRSQVPIREYEKLATRFNQVKFNADEWVKVAKDAGMKYIVITSKHHDGFALWKSKASSYNS